MITFVTSMTCEYVELLRHANTISGFIMHAPAHMNQKQEVEFAESIYKEQIANSWKRIIVPCFYELSLLRLIRKVRDGHLNHSELEVHCLNENGNVQILYLDATGEFIGRFQEGFFEGRSEELF